jgi:hypothetical protein
MSMILTDTRFFVGGADLTSASNKVEISSEVESKETTTYGSGGFKEFIGGLASTDIKASGLWEAGDPGQVDDAIWAELGTVDTVSIVPTSGVVGSVSYSCTGLTGDYQLLGEVGDVAPWQATLMGSSPLVRGVVAHPAGTARTATGTGTGQQLGGVLTGQRLYASLHVLSASGTAPILTARLESDDNAGFTSATTRGTFTAASGQTAQTISTSGAAITDDYWRIAWTISGTAPSFLFVATLGIR